MTHSLALTWCLKWTFYQGAGSNYFTNNYNGIKVGIDVPLPQYLSEKTVQGKSNEVSVIFVSSATIKGVQNNISSNLRIPRKSSVTLKATSTKTISIFNKSASFVHDQQLSHECNCWSLSADAIFRQKLLKQVFIRNYHCSIWTVLRHLRWNQCQ